VEVKKGKYGTVDQETGEIVGEYKADTIREDDAFWTAMFAKTDLAKYIHKTYSLNSGE
jgi:hypothetical protein